MNCEEIKASEEQVNGICEVLKEYVKQSDKALSCQADSLIDNIRLLRNFCVNHSNQDLFIEKNIPCNVSQILSDLLRNWKPHRKTIVCACQFMGNLVAGNTQAQTYLWNIVYPEQIRDLLQLDDPQIAAIISMIIYNCLKSSEVKIEDLFCNQISKSIVIKICESLTVVNDQDWVILCIVEHFMQSKLFLPLIFSQGSSDCRCTVLDVILCSAGDVFVWSDMPDHFLQFLAQQFAKDCGTVDNLSTSRDDTSSSNLDVVGTVKLLEVLCLVTSDYNKGRDMLMEGELIDIAVDILGRIHRAGKANSSGVFGLSQVRLPAVGAKEHNPVTGFKSNLVRVIGNLCHRNRTNQNKVRNLGGIELILDNFQLDDTNPFIRQWSICAIRNLCEDNPENQGVVASFEKISASEMPLLTRRNPSPS